MFYFSNKTNFQILRNRQFQGWRDRGQQTEGGHATRCGRYQQIQEGEPYHVRLGDQG